MDSRSRKLSVTEVLDAAEPIIRQWEAVSGALPTGRGENGVEATMTGEEKYLWDGPPGPIIAYLEAVDQVLAAANTCTLSEALAPSLDRARKYLRSAVHRLETEFYNLLARHLQPVSAKRVYKVLEEGSEVFDGDLLSERRGASHGGAVEGVKYMKEGYTLALMPPSDIAGLNSIAFRLVKTGHSLDCCLAYNDARKVVLEGSLANLGLQPSMVEDAHKVPWEILEGRIRGWLDSAPAVVRVLLASERQLCDRVFQDLFPVGDRCFAALAHDSLNLLSAFSMKVAMGERAPEKLFRVLQMFETMHDLVPDIEAVFAGKACEDLRIECDQVRLRLREATWRIFAEFENAIARDSTKSAMPGGQVHGLTRYVVNYLILLHEYKDTLAELYIRPGEEKVAMEHLVGQVLDPPGRGGDTMGGSLGEGGVYNGDEGSSGASEEEVDSEADVTGLEAPDSLPYQDVVEGLAPLTATTIWKVHVLQTNLEGKAQAYGDAALGHLFLMNNMHYIAFRFKTSNLRSMVGDDWIRLQTSIMRQHGNSYQRLTWNRVLACLKETGLNGSNRDTTAVSRSILKERFKSFNALLEEIHHTQSQWCVPDERLREELQASICNRVLPVYRDFHAKYSHLLEAKRHPERYIRFIPEDVAALISDLFRGGVAAAPARTSSGMMKGGDGQQVLLR